MRLALLLLLAPWMAGCASVDGAFSTTVVATNATPAPVTLLVKVWDPEGNLAFNMTRSLGPGDGEVVVGEVQGALDVYSGPYTWYVHDGTNTAQESVSPLPGEATLRITVEADRIRLAYAA